MKKCRIYCTYNNSGYSNEGFPGDYTRYFIDDACLTEEDLVLVHTDEILYKPQHFVWNMPPEIIQPAKRIDGKNYYSPAIGASIQRETPLPFEVNGKWGYCDTYTGQVVIEPKWDFCDEFYCGYARFNIGGAFDPMDETAGCNKWGFIDIDGDEVIAPIYQYLSRPDFCGLSLAKKDGLWGVINEYNDLIVAFQWDGIWFDYDHQWEDSHHTLEYGFVALKIKNGHKQYTAINSDGKVMAEDLPGFVPPKFPQQYIFCDDEESPEPEFCGDAD